MKKALYIIFPILLTLAPVLFFGMTFANSDFLYLHLPNLDFYREALVSGESFLWNPYIVSGFPSYASLVGGLFSPLNLLFFKFLPTISAHAWLIFLNLALAGILTAFFLRRLKLSVPAQVLGALTFVFSQWYIVSDIGIVNSFPVLPLAFLLLWEARAKNWPILAGGALFGWMFLSSHFNWLMMILVGAGFFALYLGWKTLLKLAGMLVIGLFIGAVQLYPSLTYSNLAGRGAGALSFAEASIGAIQIWDLPSIFLPHLSLPFVPQAESLLYIGLIPLFFLVIGLSIRDRVPRFMAAMFFACLVLAIKYSPLFWLVSNLPVISGFRGPSRWMFLGFFSGAVLAGYGLDHFSQAGEWKKTWTKVVVWAGMTVLIGALVLSVGFALFEQRVLGFAQNYFEQNLYRQTSGLPLDHYHRVIENSLHSIAEAFSLANPEFLFSVISIFVSVLAVYFYSLAKQGHQFFGKHKLVLIAAANFVLVFWFFHPLLPQSTVLNTPASIDVIKQDPGKAIGFLPGISEWNKLTVPHGFDPQHSYLFNSELLAPSSNALYRVESADAYENLMPRRQSRLLSQLGSDRATVGERLADLEMTPEEKAAIFADRKFLLDVLGIKYIVSAYPLDEAVFSKVGEIKATDFEIPIMIYKNTDARELVYIAEEAQVIQTDETEAFNQLLRTAQTGQTLLECLACSLPEALGTGEVGIISRQPDRIKLQVTARGESVVVFQQSHLPGWKATIDGDETQIYTADSVFMAVVVPAGEHEIEFSYGLLSLFKN